MLALAVTQAEVHELPVILIDREIGTTLKRTAHNLPWWKRWTLFTGLILSLFSREDVNEEEIEQLKQGDMLETTFSEFAHDRHLLGLQQLGAASLQLVPLRAKT